MGLSSLQLGPRVALQNADRQRESAALSQPATDRSRNPSQGKANKAM